MKMFRRTRQPENSKDVIFTSLEGTEQGIFVCHQSGGILYANIEAKRLFDLDQTEGLTVMKATLHHGIERLVRQVFDLKQTLTGVFDVGAQGGAVVQIRVWPHPAREDWAVLETRDITRLRHLETVRTDFVANVSHEIRTPLATIRAMSEVLTENDDEALRNRFLGKIMSEVDHLSRIVEDLLTLTTSESRLVTKTEFDLAALVYRVTATMHELASSKSLTLRAEIPETAMVNGNESQLKQVLTNLIGNAISYTSEGTICVRLIPSDNQLTVEVEDTGIGISAEHQARLFERFYRVDKGRSRETGGTGLGLSIVKHIVDSHGGEVGVESLLNRGSKFWFTLPLDFAVPKRS